jgi:LPS export ABC transporter protein LptC
VKPFARRHARCIKLEVGNKTREVLNIESSVSRLNGVRVSLLTISYLILTTFSLLSTSAIAQEQTVHLIHADSLVGYNSGGDNFRDLIGHVVMQQGGTVLNCDRAVQNTTRDIVDLYGNVKVEDDTLTLRTKQARYFGKTNVVSSDSAVYLNDRSRTLTADRGTYSTATKVAQFFGNVFVRDSASQLTSQQLIYYRNEEKTLADSDVKIKSLENNVTVRGLHFEDYNKKHYSLITGEPLLTQIDTSSDGKIDTLMITSLMMEAYRDSANERFIAEDSVQVIRGSLSAHCGYGIYFSKDSMVVLQKQPVVWYEDNQLTGDSVTVYISEKKINRVDVNGDAFALSQSDSIYTNRYNQLKGKQLTMYLNDRKVNRIIVENNATSLYYLYDKNKPNGVNRVSGDRVVMYFKDGKIERIAVISGVEGNYYPEKLVKNKVASYSLTGFVYHKNRPDKEEFPHEWSKTSQQEK